VLWVVTGLPISIFFTSTKAKENPEQKLLDESFIWESDIYNGEYNDDTKYT
jgi:hypothetical protein